MNVGTLEIKLLANIARLQTDMDKANQTVDRAMGRINKSVVLAKNAFAGLTAAFGGAQILRMADDYKKFDAQLRLSTRTTQEYAAAYKSVVAIARQSQSDIAAVGVLYARLTNNLRDFGTTQKEIAGITEAVSLSLRVSNATVQETNSVMLQLSQSFGSGRINGQEFLAVSEGAPIIMRQLAKSLNTTVGALKDMSAQGKLTSDVLAKALADPEYVARLREQVKEVGTISSAWTVLVNNLKIFIGEADKASGASKILQSAIVGVGDSLQFLVTAGLIAAGVAFSRWTGSIYAAAQAQAAEFAASQRAAQQKVVLARAAVTLAEANFRSASATAASTLALNNNAAATTNAARAAAVLTAAQARLATVTGTATTALAVFRGAVAFLGGPIGAVITALGLGYLAFKQFGEKSGGEMEELKRIVKELNAELEKTPALIKSKVATSFDELAKTRDKLERDLTRAKRGKIDFSTGQIFVDEAEIKRIQGLLDASLVRYQELVGAQVDANKKVEESVSEALQAEKFLREAKIKLMSEEIAAQEKIIEAAKKANIAESDRAAIIKAAQGQIDTLRGKAEKETKASKEAREAMIAYFERTNEAIVKQIELREKMYRDDEAYVAGMANVQIDATQGIYDQIDALREELANRGKLESAIQSSILARTIEKRVAMEAAGINVEAIEDEIAARKKLLDLTIKKERIEAEEKAAEESKRIWEEAEKEKRRAMERTASELSRSITDALLRGFESGKSIAENFRETLKNMFNTLILRPVIEAIVKPVAGVLGGIFSTGAFADTGGGGGLSLLSQGKSLLDAVQNGFSGLNNSLTSAIGDLGTFLSTGNGGLGDVLGGFIGQYSSQIANVLPFAGAAFSLLTGDVKGAVSQGIGAGLGMAVGGPVGGLIGGALGSVVGGLFGGSGERFKQAGESRIGRVRGGVFSSSQGEFLGEQMQGVAKSLDAVNMKFATSLSALLDAFGLRSNTRVRSTLLTRRTSGATAGELRVGGQTFSGQFGGEGDLEAGLKGFTKAALGDWLARAIRNTDLPAGIRALFKDIEKPNQVNRLIKDVLRLDAASVNLNQKLGITVNQTAKAAKEIGLVGAGAAKFLQQVSSAAESYNTIGDKLVAFRGGLESVYGGQLPQNLKAFDEALKGINTRTKAGRIAFAELFSIRSGFANFTAAIDGLKGNVRGAIYSMVSDQEKLAMQREDMAKIFTELGYAIPGSIQELVALGKSIDYTTVEGLNLASVFPTLVDAFTKAQAGVDGLTDSLRDLSTDRFRTRADFQIYSGLMRNYGAAAANDRFPMFAEGGSHTGGMRVVGERGPELEMTGPSRIIPTSTIMDALSGNSALAVEIRALRMEMQAVVSNTGRSALYNRRVSDLLDRVTPDGDAIRTEAVA